MLKKTFLTGTAALMIVSFITVSWAAELFACNDHEYWLINMHILLDL